MNKSVPFSFTHFQTKNLHAHFNTFHAPGWLEKGPSASHVCVVEPPTTTTTTTAFNTKDTFPLFPDWTPNKLYTLYTLKLKSQFLMLSFFSRSSKHTMPVSNIETETETETGEKQHFPPARTASSFPYTHDHGSKRILRWLFHLGFELLCFHTACVYLSSLSLPLPPSTFSSSSSSSSSFLSPQLNEFNNTNMSTFTPSSTSSPLQTWLEWLLASPTFALPWLAWFTDTPMHFKLNLPLAQFLSEFFSLTLEGFHHMLHMMGMAQWGGTWWWWWWWWFTTGPACCCVVPPALPSLSSLEKCLSLAHSLFSASVFSLVSAALHDLLWIATYPIHHFDLLLSLSMRSLTHLLHRLFLSFLARKYNPLRHRTDTSSHTALDQTLVATVLFTMVVFLFPTLCVYFVFFKTLSLARTLALYLLRFLIHLLHYIPFYDLVFDLLRSALPCASTPRPVPRSLTDLQLLDLTKTDTPRLVLQYRPLTILERFWQQPAVQAT